MEIRQLKIIKALANYKSYTNAAEYLNYTQSNVTQQIKKLEGSLQQKLFIYRDKTLVKTPFLNEIMPMINDILRAHDEIYSVSELRSEKGTLRVAAPESLTLTGLGDVIKHFLEYHPEINIDLYNNTCSNNQKLLLNNDVDLALVINNSIDEKSFEIHKLREEEVIIAAHYNAPDDFASLIKEHRYNHFVINEKDSTYRRMFESKADVNIKKTTELWSIGAIKSILLDDIGFSVLPRNTVKKELKEGTLKIINHKFDFDLFQSLLLTQKQNWQNPLVKLFIEQTKRHFQ